METKNRSNYQILSAYLKKGSQMDRFIYDDVICISGLNTLDTWIIKGEEGKLAYILLIKEIHQEKRILNKYTDYQVSESLNSIILKYLGRINISEEIIKKETIQALLSEEEKSFDVARNIYGVSFNRFRKLGPFIFQKKIPTLKYFSIKNTKNINRHIGNYLVRIQICSVTKERAIERADEIFNWVECLFAFIIGNKNSGREVRILKATDESEQFCIVMPFNGKSDAKVAREGMPFYLLDLDSPIFSQKITRKLFILFDPANTNEMDVKIRNSIIWIGKGLQSNSSIESIIYYCTALECLLVRDKDKVQAPSITNSLAEYCAFFLGNSKTKRIQISKKVKQIYGIRSAGIHGGKIIADRNAELDALEISRLMILKILKLYPSKIKKKEDMIQYIENKKFS